MPTLRDSSPHGIHPLQNLMQTAEGAFESCILSNQDITGYFAEIKAAFAVHIDREEIRHGLWKDYPAGDQCNQIKIKIDRILRSLELVPTLPLGSLNQAEKAKLDNAQSELDDIINYAVFAKRILRLGNVVIGS